jgi:hypothetical protein
MDIFQPSYGPSNQIRWQPFRLACYEKLLRFFIGKCFYHGRIVICNVTVVNNLFQYIGDNNRESYDFMRFSQFLRIKAIEDFFLNEWIGGQALIKGFTLRFNKLKSEGGNHRSAQLLKTTPSFINPCSPHRKSRNPSDRRPRSG